MAIRALYTYSEGMDRAAAEAAIDSNLWARCVARLRGEVLNQPRLAFGGELTECHAFLRSAAAYEASGDSVHLKPMVPLVIGAARRHFRPLLEAAAVLRQTADLRNPASWYPEARKIRRRIVMHMGPTNSGKTYSALQRLREGEQGVYCGPLRLLALEVYESLNQQGAITNLVTGQERREVMFASHTSCTVEMTNLDKEFDVAVIDEVQMIGDESRGWAWTRALLGVQAKEVHVCGDPAAAPVVRKLAAACGDELEERVYERLTPLSVSEESLGGTIRRIRKGDAVVAFSRRDIYQLRRLIERSTGHKCCVVYGRLPPETRNSQARLFNDPASGEPWPRSSGPFGLRRAQRLAGSHPRARASTCRAAVCARWAHRRPAARFHRPCSLCPGLPAHPTTPLAPFLRAQATMSSLRRTLSAWASTSTSDELCSARSPSSTAPTPPSSPPRR